MYKLLTIKDIAGNNQNHVIRDDGNGSFTSFPVDKANTDYQAFLAWKEEGNEPLPAEE
jgi:hypothetical protein